MNQANRRIYCGLCAGNGILGPDRLCPACEGMGSVRPILLSIPVLTPAQALASDTHWWSRLAVLNAELRDGRAIAHGISDAGHELTVKVRPQVFDAARRVTFCECGDQR